MALCYSAFGLSLRTNRRVPGLVPTSVVSSADTRIWLDAVPVSPRIRDLPGEFWYVSDEP